MSFFGHRLNAIGPHQRDGLLRLCGMAGLVRGRNGEGGLGGQSGGQQGGDNQFFPGFSFRVVKRETVAGQAVPAYAGMTFLKMSETLF